MIDKNSTTPRYVQLEEYIKNQINDNIYPPGSSLPTEREFTELFGVSRMTVRQAISNLVNEGILYKIRGKGALVSKKIIEKEFEIQGFSEDMISRGLVPGSDVIEFKKIIPEDDISKRLKLNQGEEVYFLNRLRLADNEPMAIEYCYIPVKFFPGLVKYNMVQCSLYDLLKSEYNLQIGYIKQKFKAIGMNKKEAELLTGKSKAFGLLSIRVLFDENDRPVECTKTIYHPDRYTFNMTLYNKNHN
ncbi:GntR family transcriptional regulator [Clostridium algidicarnis]|uniref:GntR family transcriptional regulator n=1 Tax=Clostridium algidicarnis TaxID=37659 RepID=UPI001C0B42CB|nr:GntR family transcriptional regulator [Clostridium algidicarnis]MBU3197565.1 GntR family transcriptional regulator [Clostridium algidicarnis]MBU3229124.1 GntR family transcriptional regulator [Clostridium algidicarnis]MBU3252643.1 GntR family transcriptional regulator [Clostridium algidicarnis]